MKLCWQAQGRAAATVLLFLFASNVFALNFTFNSGSSLSGCTSGSKVVSSEGEALSSCLPPDTVAGSVSGSYTPSRTSYFVNGRRGTNQNITLLATWQVAGTCAHQIGDRLNLGSVTLNLSSVIEDEGVYCSSGCEFIVRSQGIGLFVGSTNNTEGSVRPSYAEVTNTFCSGYTSTESPQPDQRKQLPPEAAPTTTSQCGTVGPASICVDGSGVMTINGSLVRWDTGNQQGIRTCTDPRWGSDRKRHRSNTTCSWSHAYRSRSPKPERQRSDR